VLGEIDRTTLRDLVDQVQRGSKGGNGA
jgi:hypothetical protein